MLKFVVRLVVLLTLVETACAQEPVRAVPEAVIRIGAAQVSSRVPAWDARGTGPLPRQGIACLDVTANGRCLAVCTLAAPGEPNLFVLDGDGKILARHRAGLRWLNEVGLSGDGRFVAALSTTPEGTAGDTPRFFAFRDGQELAQLSDKFRFRDLRPAGFLFHYGDHSNHLPRIAQWAGDRWVVALDDQVYWTSAGDSSRDASMPVRQVSLGHGATAAFAASASGRAVVGRFADAEQPSAKFNNLLVLTPDKIKPVVWSRPTSSDVARSPEPERGVYGPPAPPYRDWKFQAPLAVAIDAAGQRIAAADYEGWQRVFQPRNGGEEIVFGTRVMPSRPTIQVYDADGNTLRRIGPETFGAPFWCELTFSADGRKLFIWPHNWTSRGLGGQPYLPADADARTLYVLDVASGALQSVRFPDAISSVAVGGDRVAVGCWDRKVYLLGADCRPIPKLPAGLEVGAASLVRVSQDGQRTAVATAFGAVLAIDADGKQLWRVDLDRDAPLPEKAKSRKSKPGSLGPGIWRTNGGMAHSDMGSQIVIEAPQGLLLVDPNAGASFAQNWAAIEGAGLDPMQVKYVLLTHEHGDHAPGAYLWRVVTGAQVVASAEMAYVLQHHVPGGTGYGFHPPQPVDVVLTADKELELAGLKVKAIRLPGHTSGSMGYAFQKDGRTYVTTGDLIMPGGVLGYSGSLDFSAEDVLRSLKKLDVLRPDVVLGGHGNGGPEEFIAKGIENGEATGWSRMQPTKPNPLCRFAQTNYLVAAWLERIQSAAYGDIDGDGRPDVAVLVPKGKGSAVKIHLNQGGRFAAAPDAVIDLPDLSRGWKLRLLRLGKEKTADFFVSSEREAVVLRAVPDRLTWKPSTLSVTRGSQVVAGDFSGDGRTDLVIGSRFVTGYCVASQQADGAFRVRQTNSPAANYLDIALADVNGDRREDLIISCGDVFLRQSDGSLAETPAFRLTSPASEPQGWTFMAAGDFDHDGRTDVALLGNGKEVATVWLYRNSGNPQAPFPRDANAKFVVPGVDVLRDGPTVADFNGDGIADLVLCRRDKQPGACVLTGAAADGLHAQRTVAVKLDYVPHHDTRLGVADFNGNGRCDLVGFGPAATGAVGVYIWLQPAGGTPATTGALDD